MSPDGLREVFADKAGAELVAADLLMGEVGVIPSDGSCLPEILALKGDPGPVDLEERRALAGEDGTALRSALSALGLGDQPLLCVVTRAEGAKPDMVVARLGLLLEAADPHYVLVLDREARDDLVHMLGIEELEFGQPRVVAGRVLVAVDGLEASLGDQRCKTIVWNQMKVIKKGSGT